MEFQKKCCSPARIPIINAPSFGNRCHKRHSIFDSNLTSCSNSILCDGKLNLRRRCDEVPCLGEQRDMVHATCSKIQPVNNVTHREPHNCCNNQRPAPDRISPNCCGTIQLRGVHQIQESVPSRCQYPQPVPGGCQCPQLMPVGCQCPQPVSIGCPCPQHNPGGCQAHTYQDSTCCIETVFIDLFNFLAHVLYFLVKLCRCITDFLWNIVRCIWDCVKSFCKYARSQMTSKRQDKRKVQIATQQKEAEESEPNSQALPNSQLSREQPGEENNAEAAELIKDPESLQSEEQSTGDIKEDPPESIKVDDDPTIDQEEHKLPKDSTKSGSADSNLKRKKSDHKKHKKESENKTKSTNSKDSKKSKDRSASFGSPEPPKKNPESLLSKEQSKEDINKDPHESKKDHELPQSKEQSTEDVYENPPESIKVDVDPTIDQEEQMLLKDPTKSGSADSNLKGKKNEDKKHKKERKKQHKSTNSKESQNSKNSSESVGLSEPPKKNPESSLSKINEDPHESKKDLELLQSKEQSTGDVYEDLPESIKVDVDPTIDQEEQKLLKDSTKSGSADSNLKGKKNEDKKHKKESEKIPKSANSKESKKSKDRPASVGLSEPSKKKRGKSDG